MINADTNGQWKARDFLNLSIFGFGSTAFATPIGTVILPILILGLVPEDLKNTYLGLLSMGALGVAMVSQPLAGHMSDRTLANWGSRTPYLITGSLLAGLFVFVLGVSSTVVVLVVGLIVTQFWFNTALGPYQALIRDLAPRVRRGVASSFKVMADGSGGAISLILVAFLLGEYAEARNPLWLWLSLGVISFTLVASAGWTVLGIRNKKVRSDHSTEPLPYDARSVTNHQFGWFLGSRFCTVAALSILRTYAVFYLRDAVGVTNSAQAVGIMTLVTGGCLLLIAYPAGRLSDRIGRKRIIMASALLGGVGVVMLLFATSFLQVILVGCLLGAAAGAYFSASFALASDMVPSDHTARQMGIANTAAIGGTALANLAGPGVDLLNRVGDNLGYSTLLVASVLLFGLGALLLYPLGSSVASRPTLSH